MGDNYLGHDIPKLGFGLMRLPRIGGRSDAKIDIDQVKVMVDRFLAAGFTYFDTARAYGDSEEAIRQALVDRYPRGSFQLATKNAAWLGAKTPDEARQFFQTSLDTTGAGYFDFYLLHNLGNARTKVFDDYGLWDFVQEQKTAGLIKHVGFSMHDKADVLDAVLSEHPEVEFVQLQINYADWNDGNVQSKACYDVARKHGKPVIIMEPVKGGLLANPPAQVAKILADANPDVSASSWALRFAASLPGLITVLSGMSDIEQMDDNLATMRDFTPLSKDERTTIAAAQTVMASLDLIPCTSCEYCMKDCPQNVAIPQILACVNEYRTYGNLPHTKKNYGFATAGKGGASACIQCGQCEGACPQHLSIIDYLGQAARLFD